MCRLHRRLHRRLLHRRLINIMHIFTHRSINHRLFIEIFTMIDRSMSNHIILCFFYPTLGHIFFQKNHFNTVLFLSDPGPLLFPWWSCIPAWHCGRSPFNVRKHLMLNRFCHRGTEIRKQPTIVNAMTTTILINVIPFFFFLVDCGNGFLVLNLRPRDQANVTVDVVMRLRKNTNNNTTITRVVLIITLP